MPRIDTLEKIAHALGISAGWLAYGEGSEPDGLTRDGLRERTKERSS